jgi:hypothetical protein
MKFVVNGDSAPRTDPVLLKLIARAHCWFDDLISGRAASMVENRQAREGREKLREPGNSSRISGSGGRRTVAARLGGPAQGARLPLPKLDRSGRTLRIGWNLPRM